MQDRVYCRAVASGPDARPPLACTPFTLRRIGALLVPALTVFMLAQVRPVLAQSPIEGYWDDRFALDIYGGLSLRAEDIVTHPETGEVYVGGNFSRSGDLDLNDLAKWTGDGWEAIGQGTNGRVVAIAFAPNGDIYVGGTFTEVYQSDGTPLAAVRVARWDGAQWHALGGGIPSTVEVIGALPSGDIVVGGNFDSAENPGGQVVDVQNIVVWDGSGWGTLGAGLNNTVRALVVHPPTGDLIAGGSFVEAYNSDGSTVSSRSVVRWTGSEWRDVGGGLNGGVDDLAIGSDGTIYAAGPGAPGLIGGFDGTAWTTLGGGIPGIYARAVAFGNNKVFVGGQFQEVANSDGSRLRSPNIAAFDLDAGEWISLDPGTSSTVSTLSYDGSAVFIGGGLNWAGPFPAQFISRWIDSPPAYPAAPVTFRVDVRRLDSFGLLPLSRSVMLEVFDGANAKRFGLFDPDGDGVHSVRVPQPIGGTIRYAFFIDIDRNGFEGDNTWVFERDVTTNPRTLSIQSADPVVLPIVHFDDLPPVPFASDFEASGRADQRPGNPGFNQFFGGVNQGGATTDFEVLDRTIRLAAFVYASDPGGTAPEGIVHVAQSTYWRFETTPLAARFSASLFLEFVPGVSAPEDVRVLYRPAPDSVWQVMESEVDASGEGMIAQNVTRLSGEWTLGTVSRLNSLTGDPPGMVFDPRPVDGTLNAPLTPTLTWAHGEGAELYDLYIWPSGEMEPSSPTAANLEQPLYHATGLTGSAGSETFSWRVVARNINGETPGPVWSLEIGPAADLNVGDVQAPASAFSGQQIEVTWTVENEGAGGTSLPAWHDEVYLSDAPIFNASTAFSLGRVRNIRYLNPGESYESRATIDLPQGIQGTNYIHVVTDAAGRSGGEIAEPDEENNTSEGTAFQVTLTPYADLQVASIIAPDNAFSGDEIEISWTVQNQGSGQTDVPAWFDSIFLSEDAALDFNFAPQAGQTTIRINNPHLASTERSGALEAGESYTANARFKLPDDAIGDFYLAVYTDIQGGFKQPERGDVYEFNQELNNWASDSIRITLTPPPDLVVTNVESPGSALSGESVDLAWTITNVGPGPTRAEDWRDVVYISPTSNFDPLTAVVLGSFSHTGALLNDESYTKSASVRVPDGVGGDGFFFVHTNPSAQVFEHTFGDNNLGGDDEPSSVARAPYPDLVMSGVAVSPATATAGQQVKVSYQVANAGTRSASSWRDNIYVSSSPEWNPESALLVGFIQHDISLPPTETHSHSAVVTLPPVIDGTYYAYVWADADERLFEFPDDTGNVGRSAALTAGSYPPVDLHIEVVSSPQDASSGFSVQLEIRVTNRGEGRTIAEGWTDEIYLSEDSELQSENDVLLAQSIHQGALAPGDSYTLRTEGVLPDGLSGDVFFIFRADADGLVADADASNNSVVAPVSIELSPSADLQVTQIVTPSMIAAAEAVTVNWTITNQGQAQTAGGRWFDGVYLSDDDRVDRDDILLGTRERNAALTAGQSYQADLNVSLPAYNSGRYYLLVQTDQRDDIYEHDAEFNNTADFRVDLTLPPPADLTIENVLAPAQAAPGEPLTVEWTLVNQGDNSARGRMREAVFVSEDASWDVGDILLGVVETDVDLAPGASTQVAMKVNLSTAFKADRAGNISGEMPGVTPGDYFAIVRTDVANNIRETNEDNNSSPSTSTISADVQVLELDTPVMMAMSPDQSRLLRITIDEGRDLRLTLSSDVESAGNELYIAYSRPPIAGGDFDYSSAEPFTADQQLVVPSTTSGIYYILVVSRTGPESDPIQNLTLRAEALDFSITSISPSVGGQGQVTTMISGAGFRATSSVSLVDGAGDQHDGQIVEFVSTTAMKVRFQLQNASTGVYELTASNSDDSAARLEAAFEIEPARPFEISEHLTASDFIRAEGSTQQVYRIQNTSNVDIPFLIAQGFVPASTVVRTNATGGLMALSDFMDEDESDFDGVLAVDDLATVTLIGKNVPPSTRLEAIFDFSNFSEAAFPSTFMTQLLTTSEFLSDLSTTIEAAREEVLNDGESGSSDPLQHAASEETFRAYVFDRLVDLGVLAETDLASFQPIEAANGRFITQNHSQAPQVLSVAAPPHHSAATFESSISKVASTWQPKPECEVAYQNCREYKERWCGVAGVAYCGLVGMATARLGSLACGQARKIYCREVPRKLCLPVLRSCDPNDMIGPAGFGDEEWVAREATLPYTIRFENDPALASAPAQVVSVAHPLDQTVDPRRFRLGSFGFGPFMFDPPDNVSYYQTRLDLADSIGVDVDVTAGIDVLAGNAFWTFKSIDPATGDQPSSDPFAGFLPVNDDTKIGEGFATYTILPAEDAATGDVIDAQASIVFDINAPIDTPPVFNTVDATAPVSSVGVQPARSDTATFYVFWSGEDEGSGVRDYQLFVSQDDGPFELYQTATPDTSLLFAGELNSTYQFFSIATDNVGNVEPMKSRGEAVTAVSIEEGADPGLPEKFALHQNYPNPFNPRTTIPFDVAEQGEVQIAVYNILGQRISLLRQEQMNPGHYQQLLDMSQFASGVYLYEIRVRGEGRVRFRDVRKFVLVK